MSLLRAGLPRAGGPRLGRIGEFLSIRPHAYRAGGGADVGEEAEGRSGGGKMMHASLPPMDTCELPTYLPLPRGAS